MKAPTTIWERKAYDSDVARLAALVYATVHPCNNRAAVAVAIARAIIEEARK